MTSRWLAFGSTFAVTLGVYLVTLAPTVTLELSGSLVTAADYLGVANCPGYPLWTLVAWLFQWLFGFVRYHGQPNPAWGVNVMSAFFAALTCGMVAWLIVRFCRGAAASRWGAALSAGVLLGFTRTMWSQAVIAAQYTLNAFVIALFLALAHEWLTGGRARTLWALGFVYGLGVTTSPVFLLLLPVFLVLPWFRPGGQGAAPGAILAALCGLSILLYLPLASAQNPPMNWGHARTWTGFRHLVTGGQYEAIRFADVVRHAGRGREYLGLYARDLVRQFTIPGVILGLFGAGRSEPRRWRLILLFVFVLLSGGLMLVLAPEPDLQTWFQVRVHLIPSHVVFALWIGQGLFALLTAPVSKTRGLHGIGIPCHTPAVPPPWRGTPIPRGLCEEHEQGEQKATA